MHGTHSHLTTDAYAALTGETPQAVRRKASQGLIPGAYRLSGSTGPWRFLPPGTTAPPDAVASGGVSASTADRYGPNVMSFQRPTPADHVGSALRVADHLSHVVTRPARAAQVMLAPLVSIAARHYANRDGWCAACSWQHPCRDYLDATAGLDAAAGIVLDGAA